MVMDKPWITIAIPSYNRAHLLRETVRSVQNQTISNWECVIIDDHSSDDAWDVTQGIAAKDRRILAMRHEENRGLAANFRACGESGLAPYILMLGADDQLLPTFLEIIQTSTQSYSDAALFCGRRILKNNCQRFRPYAIPFKGYWGTGTTLARALANGNLYGLYSSVVVRRQALNEIGGIPSDNPWAGDYEAFVKISARYPVVFVPEAEVYQYVDSSTETAKMLRSGSLVFYEAMTLNRLLQDPSVSQSLTDRQVEAAWARIYALHWAVTLYNVIHGQWRSIQKLSKMSRREPIMKIVSAFVRLIYHRWRLTY